MKRLLLIIAILFWASSAEATVYQVKKTGTDDYPTCTNATNGTGELTINAAMKCVAGGSTANSSGGHTVEVFAGTYVESVDTAVGGVFPSGTSWSAPFTLTAHGATGCSTPGPCPGGDTVIWQNSGELQIRMNYATRSMYAIIQGFTFDGTNLSVTEAEHIALGNDYVRFQNNEIRNSANVHGLLIGQITGIELLHNKIGGGGFGCSGSVGGSFCYPIYTQASNTIIDGNELYGFPAYGVHFNNNVGSSTNVTIKNNLIHDYNAPPSPGGGWGIIMIGISSGGVAYNNKIYNAPASGGSIGGGGIALWSSCNNCAAYENTIYNVAYKGVTTTNATNATVRNNIDYSNGASTLDGSGTVASNNPTTNPSFVDAPNGDLRICVGAGNPTANCTGTSNAIDAGFDLSSLVSTFPGINTDITGTTRPQGKGWDIGAYEMTTGVPPPVCPATPALVASYGFENNGTDSSGNSNTATVGTGLTYTTGKYGQGVLMDGAHAVTIPHSSSLYVCKTWTISMSVKLPSALSGFTALATSNYGSGVDGWYMYGSLGAGTPLFGYNASNINAQVLYGTALSTGSFIDVAFTFDNALPSSNLKMWIAGTNVSAGNGTATLQDWSGNITLGGSPFGEYLPSGSVIDEVRIYNYVRTQAQIQSDATTPIVPTGGPPVIIKIGAASSAIKLGAAAGALKFGGGQ